jgi:predicted negative regulator of RcsB-dependent stress response
MGKRIGVQLTFMILSVWALTFGCLPQIQREVVGPKTITTPPPLLPGPLLEEKVSRLERLLASEKLSAQDREIASRLLNTYRTVRSISQDHPGQEDCSEIIQLLIENLSSLEEKYFLKDSSGGPPISEAILLFSRKRKMIMDDYLSGNYQAAVNHALELEASLGPDALTPEIGLVFAFSLAKKGMLKEALSLGERIVRELEGKPDIIHLRASMTQWRLGLGQRKEAVETYEKLIDNMDERKDLFRGIQKEISPQEEGVTTREEEQPAGSTLITALKSDAPGPMRDLFSEVDRLAGQMEFEKAKLLLLRHKIRAQEEFEIEALDRAMRYVEQAEQRAQEEQGSAASPEKEALKLAGTLIEQEKFEEAISRLEAVQGDREDAAEAQALKDLAVEKLIHRERNRAAKLFLMARNTIDPAKKEAYLLSSHEILETLIAKYPTSSLLDRLRDNIRKVEEDLARIEKGPE